MRPVVESLEGRALNALAHFALAVPGTANPYLADPANSAGPEDATDGTAPPSVPVAGLQRLTFRVAGSASFAPTADPTTPDGGRVEASYYGARGGVGPWSLPIASLVGVFLPDRPAAPPGAAAADPSAAETAPEIGQVFFIGDGLRGDGDGPAQVVRVPAGAARLFLATLDGYEWGNNGGAFDVQVDEALAPGATPLVLALDRPGATLGQAIGYRVTSTTGDAPSKAGLEIRPEGSATWIPLRDRDIARGRFVARRAGRVDVRATAIIAGRRVASNVVSAQILFPTGTEIVADRGAKALFDATWRQTRDYAENARGKPESLGAVTIYPRSRFREFGFWLLLDTATGSYKAARPRLGSVPFPPDAKDVEIPITSRPKDRVAPGGASAVYVVALFHTHTPTRYAYNGHEAGPSPVDVDVTRTNDVANIVYDYVGAYDPAFGTTIVRPGLPLNAPARIYAGGDRRRLERHV